MDKISENVNGWNKLDVFRFQESLRAGNKYTFLSMSDMGFPVSRHVIYFSAELTSYAQYSESMVIVYRAKRKRYNTKTWFYGIKDLIVFPGWVNLGEFEDNFQTISHNSVVTVKQSNYLCFDSRYLTDKILACEKAGIKPVFIKLKKMEFKNE